MSEFTEKEKHDMDIKTAIMVLAKGSKLPEYMATLDIADRLIVVRAINEFQPGAMSNELMTALVAYPEMLADVIDPVLAAKMDNLADIARAELAKWSPADLVEDLARIVEKVHSRNPNPAQNARYN
jgi:hypothetical protein